MIFGERLKKIREEKNISQSELARMVGISRSVISNYEAGKRSNIAKPFIMAIANALDVDPGSLVADWPGLAILDPDNPKTPQQGNVVPSASLDDFDLSHLKHNSKFMRTASAFDRLNEEGQSEAARQVELLGEIPRYKKETL